MEVGLWVIAPGILGFLWGLCGCACFNRIPLTWLLDYDEDERLEALSAAGGGNRRIKLTAGAVCFGLPLAVSAICVWETCENQKGGFVYFTLILSIIWMLMQAALSDGLYGIIPDEFTAGIGCAAILLFLWRLVTEGTVYHPAWGALVLGGGMFLLGLFSSRLAGMDTVGMGDCKLLGAVGMLLGPWDGLMAAALALLLCGFIQCAKCLVIRLSPRACVPFAPYAALSCVFFLISG